MAPRQIHDVDLKLLRLFTTIVRSGGFSCAQATLNLSQSTISSQMSQLEERLGMVLCTRGRSGFAVTEQGKQVFAASQRLLTAVDTFRQELGSITRQLSGDLKIGVIDNTITDSSLPLTKSIRAFNQLENNSVKIHIAVDSPDHLISQVIQGHLHFSIGNFPRHNPCLNYDPLYLEKHSLYCSSNHPFFQDRPALEVLAQSPAVLRSYGYDQECGYIGAGEGNALVNNIEALLTLVLTGNYIGFLPQHYAREWVKNGDLKALYPDQISQRIQFDIITLKAQPETLVQSTFIGLFKGLLFDLQGQQ